MKQKLLILHGWGGSDYPHWQSWLAGEVARDYGCVCFPLLDNPHFPSKNRQMRQVRGVVEEFAPHTVVCHSLANVIWFHLCNEGALHEVERLLLVAPPSPQCRIENIRKFFPYEIPKNLYAKEAMLVTSSNDPHLSPEDAQMLQKELGIPMKVLHEAGHIDAQSGYGEWTWVKEWVMSTQ